MIARRIGDRPVSAVALGAANLTFSGMDAAAATRVVHAAVDAGITWIDTAYAYTTVDEVGHNERLVGRALASHPRGGSVGVGTKAGHLRAGPDDFPVDGRPATLRAHCEASLRALGVDRLALLQLHHVDPRVPLADSVGALAGLRTEGKVEHIGLSNVDLDQFAQARAVTTIASVQNHFSPQDPGDGAMVDACAALGVTYLAWSPLGGRAGAGSLAADVPALARVADRHGTSVPRVAVAWLLARSPTLVPVVGARRPATATDSAAAAELTLDDADLRDLATLGGGTASP